MPTLEKLIQNISTVSVTGDLSREITSLTCDSRQVVPGSLFFAVKGTLVDGHRFIGNALSSGATAIICTEAPPSVDNVATFIIVDNIQQAMGEISSAFYDNPSGQLKLVGVTGTNGKTTTATLLYETFQKSGYRCGLISTVTYIIDRQRFESTHTTPDVIRINELLRGMVDAGCDYCFMEVSSHGLSQGRTAGLKFTGGIFSNITHDHLDYHGTFAGYLKTKKLFFDRLPQESFALINADDRNGTVMVQNTKADVKTYSLRGPADFRARILEKHFDGMLLEINDKQLWTRLTGKFNAYNLLAVYGAAVLSGLEEDEALTAISSLGAVEGRFQTIRSTNDITAIIDYAHTPDALKNVIDTINEIRAGDGRLTVIAGCGGDRDPLKRSEMGRIAATDTDMAILTADNPRSEDPDDIIRQMEKGINPGKRYLCITDRRQAIRAALGTACPGDIILVAGKGHETYQEVNGVRKHFDDREEVVNAMKEADIFPDSDAADRMNRKTCKR